MTSLADKAILSGADNRPPMLKKDMYDSWKSRMELYMLNRQHGRMILESVKSGPLLWPTIEENGVTRLKKYSELSPTKAIQADCDVNTKFLNTLPPEWSKFVTDVKLVRDLHTTNVDQLHAYLGQHEYHANEVRLMHEWSSDPLALVADHQMNNSTYQQHQQSYHQHQFQPQASTYQSSQYATPYHPPQHASQAPSSTPLSLTYPSNDYQSSVNHNGDDPIITINQIMSFVTSVVTSRYPVTNNQLRTSSNPRQQATINNRKVTIQPIQGKQNSMTVGSSRPYTSRSNGTSEKQRVIVCYNCKGEGHMSKQCTKPKRRRDEQWFKDKVLLVQAQANRQVLQEEELEFLADPGIAKTSSTHVIEKSDAIVIHDSKETLLLAEESRSKMIQKQNEPIMFEKKVNTKPVDYATLNQLSKDFKTHLVPQAELSAEQAFWYRYSVQFDEPNLSVNVALLAPKLRNNRTTHTDYLRHTQEETATLREIVERTKLMAVTSKNNDKKIRLTKHIPSSGNTTVKTTSSTNVVSNTHVLSSTGVNLLSSASGSQPQGNTKNDRIQRAPSKAKKNKLEDHHRTVIHSLT
nr:hypothetical protein [Tanacetum cinerariifolium]